MQKFLYLLLVLLSAITHHSLTAQVSITVSPDSVYAEKPASEAEISLPSEITNKAGSPVLIRWTRVIEQKPQEWSNAFCDKNLCYLAGVSTKTFTLANNETGLLKPIFYPNATPGMGVMRLYYASETPGITWADTAVYVAVATEVVGTVEVEQVKEIGVYPNPAHDMLQIVTADATLQGEWQITDAAGKVWSRAGQTAGPISGQISVAHLPAGVYLFQVLSGDGQRHIPAKRFTVQR